MINHARTLLLNRSASYFKDVPGSQYIDAAFIPLVLNNAMTSFQRRIIPLGIDPATENTVVASVMRILHCPELATYTLQLDPRITYDDSVDFARFVNTAMNSNMRKSEDCDLTVKYNVKPGNIPNSVDTAGVYEWVITSIDDANILITPSRGKAATMNVIDRTDTKRSRVVTLIPDYLSFRFTMPTGYLTGNFRLVISMTLPIPYNIAEFSSAIVNIVGNPNITSTTSSDIAAARTMSELRSNITNSSETTIKFGSAVLMYIYQCDSLLRVRV